MKERRFRTFTSNLIICVVLGAVLVTALFAVTDAGEAVITGGAVYEGDRDGGKVALMFNVYEGTEYVEKIARLLSERGMSATFFLGGIWAERNGDTVIRLAADGFELGNHARTASSWATTAICTATTPPSPRNATARRSSSRNGCFPPLSPTFPQKSAPQPSPNSSHRHRAAWATPCTQSAKSSATPS